MTGILLPIQSGDLTTIAEGINRMWVLVVTFLIFFMHAGFAMLEAGQVRSKNVANQLTKNLLTWSIGVSVFFLVGAGVSSLVGIGSFATTLTAGSIGWIDWLFGAVFAMTAATIVSGAVAGRVKLRAYVTYTVLLAAVIYPVVTGLTWGGGLLSTIGYTDFAGGMIVHGMGGIAGLTAAWIQKVKIECVVADIPAEEVVTAIREAANTGEPGDVPECNALGRSSGREAVRRWENLRPPRRERGTGPHRHGRPGGRLGCRLESWRGPGWTRRASITHPWPEHGRDEVEVIAPARRNCSRSDIR